MLEVNLFKFATAVPDTAVIEGFALIVTGKVKGALAELFEGVPVA